MSPTLIATIAGLITALCWGTSDFLSAKSAKQLTPLEVNLGVQTISIVMVAVLFVFSGLHVANADQFIRISLSSMLVTLAYLIFVKALASGVVGIVVPLSNIYPLITILLTIVFLNAHFKIAQLAAMIIIVLGAALLAYEKSHKKMPWHTMSREIWLALATALVWGLAFFVLDPIVKQVTWQSITIIGEVASFILGLVLIIAVNPRQAKVSIGRSLHSKLPFGVGAIGTIGITALYLGATRSGSVAIPTVLSAGGPLVASFWAATLDHEKLGGLKRAGAVLVVAGVIMLNII
jgi:drug/metabolite transporter (DMT)-like permease